MCKFNKALYGLKQVPRDWYAKIKSYLQKVGFHRGELYYTLNVQIQGNNLIILVIYVDDLLITGNNDDHIS